MIKKIKRVFFSKALGSLGEQAILFFFPPRAYVSQVVMTTANQNDHHCHIANSVNSVYERQMTTAGHITN